MTTLFVSHGAPSLALQPGQTGMLLSQWASLWPRPSAILVVSAHWTTRIATVSSCPLPTTLHDFSGFDPALYTLRYPAPGAPALAQQVVHLLQTHQIAVAVDDNRGLDHGAWVPLRWLYPQADIPVTQLSIQPHQSPEAHFALGRALQALHAQNVLILASGAVTHNLSHFFSLDLAAPPLPYVLPFADWLAKHIAAQDWPSLLDYRRLAPDASVAHPTEEHLMPLFVAAGSAQGVAIRYTPETTYGILAMDCYAWPETSNQTKITPSRSTGPDEPHGEANQRG